MNKLSVKLQRGKNTFVGFVSMAISTKDHQVGWVICSTACPGNNVVDFKTFRQLVKAAVFASVASFFDQSKAKPSPNKHQVFVHASTAPVRIAFSKPISSRANNRTELPNALIRSLFRERKDYFAFKTLIPIDVSKFGLQSPSTTLLDLCNSYKNALRFFSSHMTRRDFFMSYYTA